MPGPTSIPTACHRGCVVHRALGPRAGHERRERGTARARSTGQRTTPVEDPLISLDQSAAAATDPDGQLLTAALQTPSRWADARTALRSRGGSWDRTGALWLPDPDAGAQMVNVLGSQKIPVQLDQVRSVQISRDGSRALVVAGPRDAATAYLLRVDRTTGPPRLTRPRALVTGPVRAAAWRRPRRWRCSSSRPTSRRRSAAWTWVCSPCDFSAVRRWRAPSPPP